MSFFNGMAVATALAVGFTMAASLTLLPALLSLFGLKVLPRKQRAAVRAGQFIDDQPVGLLGAVVAVRRPAPRARRRRLRLP